MLAVDNRSQLLGIDYRRVVVCYSESADYETAPDTHIISER
jgi:hypothetical protein